jgi:hypothetical protein
MFQKVKELCLILLLIFPVKQDDIHITPGFTIQEISPDLAFESYAV